MKIKDDLVNAIDLVARTLHNSVQPKDLSQHLALVPVGLRLPQVLRLILVQRRVQEEVGYFEGLPH